MCYECNIYHNRSYCNDCHNIYYAKHKSLIEKIEVELIEFLLHPEKIKSFLSQNENLEDYLN